MKSTVIRIDKHKGWKKYTTCMLSCGHGIEGKYLPTQLKCFECGYVYNQPLNWHPCPKCNSGIASFHFIPDEHNDAHILTKVGDVVDCEYCMQEKKDIETVRDILKRDDISHTRYRDWCGQGQIYIYKRDASSPSGVLLLTAIAATKEIEDMLSGTRLSPLSPTEGL